MSFLLRPCTAADSALLDSWEPPQGDLDHLHWLLTQQQNPLTRVFIGECENNPVCLGRLTEHTDHTNIGWFVAPQYRGSGYGFRLATLLREQTGKPLQASIATDNPASEAIAARLGMVPASDGKLRLWIEPTTA